jgi:hypothetical protein
VWGYHSMLKATLKLKRDINISYNKINRVNSLMREPAQDINQKNLEFFTKEDVGKQIPDGSS